MAKREKRYDRTTFAKKVGVSRSTLYYWEHKGLLIPKRNLAFMPYYTDEDFDKVRKDWSDSTSEYFDED